MAFKIIFTPRANKDYVKCIDYLLFALENGQAARNVLNDIEETLEKIRENATSYALCDNDKLAKRGMHKVHLGRHSYKIFYTVSGDNVFIRAILHDKQDFENLLK